ncbi:PorP/SprF family type IX secretion system membrane protein [Gillisia marina]|uniref:PorP/SprF family type IX secretion system membrane protein n=1 Tax=Gillisia marina TaxID=1167637 RepID=UPI0002E466DF|nr:type IX secretion system membrane protein PorP/SprF [Gillisia marina]
MKKIYIQICLSIGIVLFTLNGYAQIEPKFTHYFFNLQNINPAATSTLETTTLTGIIRSQWQGIEGAPESQLLSLGFPLNNNKMGIGINIVNDIIGPSSYRSFEGNYSYSIRLSENSSLALGINLGATLLDVDFTKGNFENPGDAARSNVNNRTYFKSGAGLIYHTENWYLGLAVPNFFKQDFYDEEIGNVIADKFQYNLHSSYLLYINSRLDFVPSVLATIVNGNPITLNTNANFMYNNKFNFGVGYRYNEALNASIGFNFLSHFHVGYSYDLSLEDFGRYNDGSHEIILKYKFDIKPGRPDVLNIF